MDDVLLDYTCHCYLQLCLIDWWYWYDADDDLDDDDDLDHDVDDGNGYNGTLWEGNDNFNILIAILVVWMCVLKRWSSTVLPVQLRRFSLK